MQITTPIFQLAYDGPPLQLAGAGFLANVRLICLLNPGGNGFLNYVPSSKFPPFTTLEAGNIYLVYSRTVGYIIPTSTSEDSAVYKLDGTTIEPDSTVFRADQITLPGAVQGFAGFTSGVGEMQISFKEVDDETSYQPIPIVDGVLIPAYASFRLRVIHEANKAFFATFTCNLV